MKPTTRPITAADAGFARSLFGSVRRADFPGLPEPLVDQLLEQQFKAFEAACRAWSGVSDLLVELDGRPIGRLVVSRTDEQMLVLDVSLIEDARGRGVGGTLLGELAEEASLRGIPIRLHVDARNGARRLYERLGFVLEEIREPTIQYVRHPRKRDEVV